LVGVKEPNTLQKTTGALGSKGPQTGNLFHTARTQVSTLVDRHRTGISLSVFCAGLMGAASFSALALQAPFPMEVDVQYSQTSDALPSALLAELDGIDAVIEETDFIDATDIAVLQSTDEPDIETLIEQQDMEPLLEVQPSEPILPPEPTRNTESVEVKSGDTLMNVLIDAGIPRQDAYYAIEAMSEKLDPRKIRAGQKIDVTFQIAPEPGMPEAIADELSETFEPTFLSMAIKTDVDRTLEIARSADGDFVAEEVRTELSERFMRAKAKIDSSLFVAAQEVGIPSQIIVELIRMYSYDVDFQREIRQGDEFEVFYTELLAPNGETVKAGNIHYGNLILRGKGNPYYRFETPDDGQTDYYSPEGQSAKKFLMKTPVDGARLSSGFGFRKHPISGYRKKHKGTDFAAPRGTPVMAAGNGTVERASRFGGFGKYIRIRHANGYKTAYAHLNGYAKGVKAGARVKQGQIIGYVGSTGNSTGPHLHYEVHQNGVAVNPMKIRVPTGRKLKGEILQAFLNDRADLDVKMAAITPMTKINTAQLEQ